MFRDALRAERRLDAVGSCTTRHNLDFCTRGRFVRRAAVVKVIAALVVFTVVITSAGVLAGAALSGDEHAATPSLGPDASFAALLVERPRRPTRLLRAGSAALRLGRITVDHPREFLVDSRCPAELEPGAAPCPIGVRFRPAVPGERTSELRIELEGVGVLSAELSGIATSIVHASLEPGTLDFGETEVGARTANAVTLRAGSEPLRIDSISSDAHEFSTAAECPETLEAGESCTIGLSFTPASRGARAATLTVTSADGGVLESELRGTGLAKPSGTVDSPVLDDVLDLGKVEVGGRSTEQTVILSAGSKSLTVAAVESDSPEFRVGVVPRGPRSARELRHRDRLRADRRREAPGDARGHPGERPNADRRAPRYRDAAPSAEAEAGHAHIVRRSRRGDCRNPRSREAVGPDRGLRGGRRGGGDERLARVHRLGRLPADACGGRELPNPGRVRTGRHRAQNRHAEDHGRRGSAARERPPWLRGAGGSAQALALPRARARGGRAAVVPPDAGPGRRLRVPHDPTDRERLDRLSGQGRTVGRRWPRETSARSASCSRHAHPKSKRPRSP